MPENQTLTVTLEQVEDFVFKVGFDPGMAELLMDEPEPIGAGKGPNATRLLAAAVGNCLSASLYFCMKKAKVDPKKIRAEVEARLARNENGRMRVGGLAVKLHFEAEAGDPVRVERCLKLFEDYCIVTQSIRRGVPVDVAVFDGEGRKLAPV